MLPWLKWVSNPPSEQKKIWRFSPRLELWVASLISLAICFNWLPRDVFGNAVSREGLVLSNKLLSTAWEVTRAALLTSVGITSSSSPNNTSSRAWSDFSRRKVWFSGVGAGESTIGRVLAPVLNTVTPATEAITRSEEHRVGKECRSRW